MLPSQKRKNADKYPFDYVNGFWENKKVHYNRWEMLEGGFVSAADMPAYTEQDMQVDMIINEMSPLDVILQAMRESLRAEDIKKAAYYANLALPYTSPKLNAIASSVTVKQETPIDWSALSLDELNALHKITVIEHEG